MKRALSTFIFVLLLVNTLTFAFNTQNVEASGTIYIRADGSVDPPTAPIQRDGDTYTLTGNIMSDADGIVIERDNMTLDGAGYTLQGPYPVTNGITLTGRRYIIIKNMEIRGFQYGIVLSGSSNNGIYENNITCQYGIVVVQSSNYNSIIRNNMTASGVVGIYVRLSSNFNSILENNIADWDYGIIIDYSSDYNIAVRNDVTNNGVGIELYACSNNTVAGNNIADNNRGISLSSTSNNYIYHNDFINNTMQVLSENSANIWDDGYPSGGNYWSDYNGTDLSRGPYRNETGSDGIGDTSYVIDSNNTDYYPLMQPWTGHDIAVFSVVSAKTVIGEGLCGNVTVYVANNGDYPETFNVTAYANATVIGTQQVNNLNATGQMTLTFTLNTTGFAYGNYTLSAYAEPVQGETNTANNNFTGGWVVVSLIGDITGPDGWPDGKVDIRDVSLVARNFGQAAPPANPNYDLTGPIAGVPDGKIDIRDVSLVARHFGDHYP